MSRSAATQVNKFYDHDTERALLGGLLLSPEQMRHIGLLNAHDFHDEANAWLFEAMHHIHEADGDFTDLAALNAELDGMGRLQDVQQAGYLTEIVELHPSPHNLPDHLARIRDFSDKRTLYLEARDLMIKLDNGDYDNMPADIIRDAMVGKLRQKIATPEHLQAKRVWTMDELLSTEFPELRWVVPGLLPIGLSWLAGRPKLGKSWLGLQMAIAVGSGGRIFDEKIRQGRVLFLAFEDSARRLQDRAKKQGATKRTNVTFATDWATFGEGGLTRLKDAIVQQGYGFVVIDTFSRAAGMADQRDPAQMTMLIGELQDTAQSQDMAILVIDHHRKSANYAPDPIDDIIESTAKAAVVDTAWGFYKERGKQGATLMIRGRDVEDRELSLQWDGLNYCWQYEGEANDVRSDTLKGQILGAIEDLNTLGEMATQTTVAEHLDKDRGNIGHALADLLNGGQIVKCEKIGRQQPYRCTHT